MGSFTIICWHEWSNYICVDINIGSLLSHLMTISKPFVYSGMKRNSCYYVFFNNLFFMGGPH